MPLAQPAQLMPIISKMTSLVSFLIFAGAKSRHLRSIAIKVMYIYREEKY
ncbi:MAG: hypothetical protein FWH42_04225 [Dehalococcoidia bacterium]|nr:hypothetical protein [Dehalococcoidia bacterium]